MAPMTSENTEEKRELYEIGIDDIGWTSSAFSDWVAGRTTISKLMKRVNVARATQRQQIARSSVGHIETEIPDLVESPFRLAKPPRDVAQLNPQPEPAILRTDIITDKKLLIVDKEIKFLNNFKMFLAISERAFKEEYAFFVQPHTTRIIWGGNRIIFILTHASSTFSIYYDIELFEDVGGNAGGNVFPTTTIITKNRIFIPIPTELKKYFEILLKKMKGTST